MDSESVKAELAKLAEQIQTLSKAAKNPQSEAECRKLWRDLELLKMSIDDATKVVSDEVKEVRFSFWTPKSTSFRLTKKR